MKSTKIFYLILILVITNCQEPSSLKYNLGIYLNYHETGNMEILEYDYPSESYISLESQDSSSKFEKVYLIYHDSINEMEKIGNNQFSIDFYNFNFYPFSQDSVLSEEINLLIKEKDNYLVLDNININYFVNNKNYKEPDFEKKLKEVDSIYLLMIRSMPPPPSLEF